MELFKKQDDLHDLKRVNQIGNLKAVPEVPAETAPIAPMPATWAALNPQASPVTIEAAQEIANKLGFIDVPVPSKIDGGITQWKYSDKFGNKLIVSTDQEGKPIKLVRTYDRPVVAMNGSAPIEGVTRIETDSSGTRITTHEGHIEWFDSKRLDAAPDIQTALDWFPASRTYRIAGVGLVRVPYNFDPTKPVNFVIYNHGNDGDYEYDYNRLHMDRRMAKEDNPNRVYISMDRVGTGSPEAFEKSMARIVKEVPQLQGVASTDKGGINLAMIGHIAVVAFSGGSYQGGIQQLQSTLLKNKIDAVYWAGGLFNSSEQPLWDWYGKGEGKRLFVVRSDGDDTKGSVDDFVKGLREEKEISVEVMEGCPDLQELRGAQEPDENKTNPIVQAMESPNATGTAYVFQCETAHGNVIDRYMFPFIKGWGF